MSTSTSRIRISTATALLVACVAGATFAVAPAQAAPGADAIVKEQDFLVPSYGSGAAWVTCPPPSRVVGGGVGPVANSLTDPFPRGNWITVSGPLNDRGETASIQDGDIGRFWYAHVRGGSGVNTPYKVYALCSATSDATIEEATFSAAPNGSASGRAACPAGKRVTGGGVGTTVDRPDDRLVGSFPLDTTGFLQNTTAGDVGTSWKADVANDKSIAVTFKVMALCSATSDAIVADASSTTQNSARWPASCGPARRVTGGGMGAVFASQVNSISQLDPGNPARPTGGLLNGDVARFFTGGVSVNAPAMPSMKVFAMCATDAAP